MEPGSSSPAPSYPPESLKTPSRNFLRRFDLDGISPTFKLPATPTMQRLGYGTGVDVFLMNRSPIRLTGEMRSPWAVKVVSKLKDDRKKRKLYLQRLEHEANLLKELDHPNIIGFRNFSKLESDRGCLAMEKASASLSDIIEVKYDAMVNTSGFDDTMPQFSAEKMLRVAEDMAKALEYLHDQAKILHGDVKSGNVLVFGDFQTMKLADFGVSRRLKDDGTIAEGKYVGTELWAPLEAIRQQRGLPHEPITNKADIYPYGLLFFEMFSLKPPHLQDADSSDLNMDEETFEEMLNGRMGTRPPLPELDYSDDYSAVVSLFYCCTDEVPAKRPDAKEVLELIDEFRMSSKE